MQFSRYGRDKDPVSRIRASQAQAVRVSQPLEAAASSGPNSVPGNPVQRKKSMHRGNRIASAPLESMDAAAVVRCRPAPVLLRKEVIQPHLPVRLPCYDLVLITDPTFDGSLHKG